MTAKLKSLLHFRENNLKQTIKVFEQITQDLEKATLQQEELKIEIAEEEASLKVALQRRAMHELYLKNLYLQQQFIDQQVRAKRAQLDEARQLIEKAWQAKKVIEKLREKHYVHCLKLRRKRDAIEFLHQKS